jgi:dihydroorotase
MSDTDGPILIESPFDAHVHFRQGPLLNRVVPWSAGNHWSGGLAMPNTDPPLTTVEQLLAYRDAVAEAAAPWKFRCYHTLYFQETYDRALLEAARPHILAIKFYPRGLTSNSQHGCDPGSLGVYRVLELMEELGISLSVHPEAAGYYHDRERLFGPYARDWARRFPKLQIVLEHLSDAASLPLLDLPNVYATVTPHHLLTTGNDWFGPPFDAHLYGMPCVKRPEDRDALRAACFHRYPDKIMAGTDSAPWVESKKVGCGCAGVFTAPIALALYARAFAEGGALGRLPAFLGGNAWRIYGVELPRRPLRLERGQNVIPDRYRNAAPSLDLVPMWAGRDIGWRVVELGEAA